MIRAVFDTSALVSYVLTEGEIMSKLVDSWEDEAFVAIFSPQTYAELIEVFSREKIKKKALIDLPAFAEEISFYSEHVPGTLEIPPICRDPKDDKFLVCAEEGGAQYIVSIDKDLLDIKQYKEICILNPGQFLVVLQIARLSEAEIAKKYTRSTLKAIQAQMCLDPEISNKLTGAVARGG